MAARLVDDPPDLILGMAMAFDQLPVAVSLLERVEVLALDILDQRKFRGRRIVDLADDRRNAVEPRPLRRPPAALASDDHIILAVGPKQDRLEDAAQPDRLGELVERFLVELDARLVRVRPDPRNLDLAHATARGFRRSRSGRGPRRLAEQRLEPHAEALGRPLGAHAATASCGSLP